jgi:hypothetical protein
VMARAFFWRQDFTISRWRMNFHACGLLFLSILHIKSW